MKRLLFTSRVPVSLFVIVVLKAARVRVAVDMGFRFPAGDDLTPFGFRLNRREGVRDLHQEIPVVRHDDTGEVDDFENMDQLLARFLVQPGGGFIKEQRPRLHREHRRD